MIDEIVKSHPEPVKVQLDIEEIVLLYFSNNKGSFYLLHPSGERGIEKSDNHIPYYTGGMTMSCKRNRFPLIQGGFLLCILLLAVANQASAASAIAGLVKDIAIRGLPGAAVTIKNGSGATMGTPKTDQNGNFSIADVPDGDYFITDVTKAGYDWISPPSIVNPGSPVNVYMLSKAASLADAILVMQILTKTDPGGETSPLTVDFDNNGRIGFPDAVYILQTVAGLR